MIVFDLWSKLKTFLVLQVCLGVIFVGSGVLVSAIIALLWLLIGTWNTQLYRRIYCYFTYSVWINFTFMAQWWSDLTLEGYGDPKEFATIGSEHVFVTMNHKYDIDWLIGWVLCERLGILGSNKTFAKTPLRWVPVIGWIWTFTETIFLQRRLDKDKQVIEEQMKALADFPADLPVTVLFFPEGTRFTLQKHVASLEFARKRNLPLLKHHLTPRVRGFHQAVLAMKSVDTFPAILDLTIGFHEKPFAPTLLNLVCGRKIRAAFHFRRIEIKDIPTETEEECSKWLHEFYVQKDAKMEEFFNTGRFPGSPLVTHRRPHDLIVYMMWVFTIGGSLLYWLVSTLVQSSLQLNLVILLAVILFSVLMRSMISVTEAHKGSAYGAKKHS